MRTPHKLNHTVTSTMNMGLLTPMVSFEGFPGDKLPITNKILARTLPQVGPTMHDVHFGVDYHEVPYRQVFDKMGLSWDNFLTGGVNGTDTTVYPTVTVPATGWKEGSLADFLGLPANYIDPGTGDTVIVGAGLRLNCMVVLCYIHVWNTYYCDHNFVAEIPLTAENAQKLLDGTYEFMAPDGETPLGYSLGKDGILPKAWRRDYFGRCLPNTQRGPQVQLPIGGTASLSPTLVPVASTSVLSSTANDIMVSCQVNTNFTVGSAVEYNILGKSGTTILGDMLGNKFIYFPSLGTPSGIGSFDYKPNVPQVLGTFTIGGNTYRLTMAFNTLSGSSLLATSTTMEKISGDNASTISPVTCSLGGTGLSVSTRQTADLASVQADLAGASAIGIIAFRTAARMQHFGELLNFTGYRAVEFTLGFFGVKIPDDRVQWPIYHGGFSMPVIFSEVLQTSNSTANSPQGNLAGHGITGANKSMVTIRVKEHCFIFGLAHIMPMPQYHTQLPRHLLRSTRWDIPNPVFEFVGEQPVYDEEIYPNTTTPGTIFGFVPRYSELSYIPSVLRGQMRSAFASWNMARLYTSQPQLSAAWRYEVPTSRTMAVTTEDQFQVDFGFFCRAIRPFRGTNATAGIHIV